MATAARPQPGSPELGPGAPGCGELTFSSRAGTCRRTASPRCCPECRRAFWRAAYLVQAVRAAGKCDAVFKGFSDCLLKLGDSMANYPQGLDDKTNIKTVCTYWEDFHSCTVTALTDCQEGAKDMWDKLRKESKNLNIQGSLFELCGSGNGAAGSLLPAFPVLLVSLSAALATWLSF
ncbi:neuritin isoform X2 [Pan troglodytes]|uniref:neuritin isoform X2 n=1 Tax=Pan troglodytes TaxID=9598 RepID=UPI003013C7F6